MTHLPQQIAPLKSWDEFEDLCFALFQKEWQNPMAQKHGRPGQPQNGVDVFGENPQYSRLWYGVQCKRKGGNSVAKLTIAEIDEELEKADTFTPRLAHWIIVTTAAVDVKLQAHARTLTDHRRAAGLCPVTVYGWGDIEVLLLKHLEVTRRFYPSHFEAVAPPPKFHVPQAFHLSDYFSDPLDNLQTLRTQLQAQGETAVLAKTNVQGMGGVGKTQLALKYSEVFRESYVGVWWFSAETQGGLESDCLLFCEKQGIPVAQNESPGNAVRDWLAGQANWLLMYDNAEDVNMVRPFFPKGGKHHLLLTSRNPNWAGMTALPLGVWNEEQGLLFLRARLQQAHGSAAELKALSKALDGLPLALEQACAYILSRKISVAKYVAALAQNETATRLLNRKDASGCPRAVLATLSLAFDQLSAAAQELLKLCSWMAAEPILASLFTEQPDELPLALREAVQDEMAWCDTLAELESYALCQIAPVTLTDHVGNPGEEVNCLSFHRLTQAAAQIAADGRATLLILTLPNEPRQPNNWPRYKALMPHVAYMNEHYQEQWGGERQLWWLLSVQALYLKAGPAAYQSAHLLYLRALALAEKTLGPAHSETGIILINLAVLYKAMGKYDAALPLSLRALAIVEETHGPDHPDTGTCLNNLAEAYRAKGDYDNALALFLRALVIAEKAQGLKHTDMGSILNNLAGIYRVMGNFPAALAHYQRAMSILEKEKGPEHPICLNNLAVLYKAMGDYEAALPLFQLALNITEKVYGLVHPVTGVRLNNLAMLYEAKGDDAAALLLFQRAVAIAEEALDPDHPNSKSFRANLAVLQTKMNLPA